MTENEIVQYLKENKNKGIAFGFMPEEVQIWAKNNSRELCVYCQPMESLEYEWMRIGAKKLWYPDHLYALPDDFKLKEKHESGWVEFDITDKGLFFLEYTDRSGSNVSHRFYWHQWSQFLGYCDIDELKYTAFGGWQYEGDEGWFMSPCIKTPKNTLWTYNDSKSEGLPAIPVKIRFWREKK